MTPHAGHVAGKLGGGGALEVPVGRVIFACLLCLIVALLAILLIRQRMGRGHPTEWLKRLTPGTGVVEIVEVRRLTLHADIGVVRHDGREYLLLVQAGASRVLREVDVPTGQQ